MIRRVSTAFDLISTALAVPAGLAGSYLGLLSVLASSPKPRPGDTSLRFTFVVPAHNESLSIAHTVRSLAGVDYPSDQMRIVVVADNCTDDTADVARAAGADVLVRTNEAQRGKGYALALAFAQLLDPGPNAASPDAVVVVDADTVVSSNILQAFAAALREGEQVLQATYRVGNHDATWRTSLMAVAFTCIHDVRSIGRERLGLSTGLRGNGMCFSTEALRLVPHHAASLVEDVEHGLDLANAGIRVAFVHEATVEAEMPERAEESASQRDRWERGRTKLKRERLPGLVRKAVAQRDPVLADLAVDLAIAPLARLSMFLGVGLLTSAIGRVWIGRWPKALWPTLAGVLGLVGHVGVGWQKSGTGIAGVRALFHVPGYILWKLRLRPNGSSGAEKGLVKSSPDAEEWVRTKRNSELASTQRTDR